MKKLLTILLTLTMILGMAIPAQAATFSYSTSAVKIDKKTINKRKKIAESWLTKSQQKEAKSIMNKVAGGKNDTAIGKYSTAALHHLYLAMYHSYFRYADQYSALGVKEVKFTPLNAKIGSETFNWKVNGKDAKKAASYNKAFENFLIKNINEMGVSAKVKKKGMQYYTADAKAYVKKMLKTKNYITNSDIAAYRKKVGDTKFINSIAKEMHYYLVYETEYTSKKDIRVSSIQI